MLLKGAARAGLEEKRAPATVRNGAASEGYPADRLDAREARAGPPPPHLGARFHLRRVSSSSLSGGFGTEGTGAGGFGACVCGTGAGFALGRNASLADVSLPTDKALPMVVVLRLTVPIA